jgi:pilus assembly protein Flp/PilA
MILYIRNVLQRRKDEGATAVEYGLLVAAIAAVIVALVFALGGFIKGAFKTTCDNIADHVSNPDGGTCAPANPDKGDN